MQGRDRFIQNLLDTIDEMIENIDERETIDSDFNIARELAEQLREEISSLQE